MEAGSEIGQRLRPGVLHVVQHERHELNLRFLGRRVGSTHRCASRANRGLHAEIREEITTKDQTEGEHDYCPAESKASAQAATAQGSPILEVGAPSSRCPKHRVPPKL